MATTRINLSGPIFDGQAEKAAQEFTDSLAAEIAAIGQTWIQIEAHGMDKSGRGGTGAAAGGVQMSGGGGSYVISGGISKGSYAWPWLEGTSRRNQGNKFKGYHTFQRTRLRMRTQVTPYAQQKLQEYLPQMGGA